MKTVHADQTLPDWRQLARDTRREPVKVVGEGDCTMVILSEAEYERIKGQGWDRLSHSMDRLSTEAEASGLSEEKLAELLADES